MVTIPELGMNFKSDLKLNFNGGNLTSDSGMLLFKEFDNRIGFSSEINKTVNVNDNIDHRFHENTEVILQRIYQNTAGYHADDDADDLRFDPLFKTILNKEALASQPTISRLNNKLDIETMKQLQQANFNLQDKVYELKPPEEIIFDLDSTHSETYGEQYGANFNTHYGSEGYHPLVMFDGASGDLIKAALRAGNVHTSRKAVQFVGPIFKKYNKKFKDTPLYLRADSGFAKPGLYEIAEEHNIAYTIRLKANNKLYKLAEPITEKMIPLCQENMFEKQVVYGEFQYQAGSWDKERRVIVKIEKPKGQLIYNYTFIVTSIKHWTAREIINFYCNRGTMENFIKEAKNGFALSKMSSTDYFVNANKLQQMVLAYNLNNWMRRLCFPKSYQSDRIKTIRNRLIKIAGRFVKTGRYLYYKLASSCPHKKLFYDIYQNIQKLKVA